MVVGNRRRGVVGVAGVAAGAASLGASGPVANSRRPKARLTRKCRQAALEARRVALPSALPSALRAARHGGPPGGPSRGAVACGGCGRRPPRPPRRAALLRPHSSGSTASSSSSSTSTSSSFSASSSTSWSSPEPSLESGSSPGPSAPPCSPPATPAWQPVTRRTARIARELLSSPKVFERMPEEMQCLATPCPSFHSTRCDEGLTRSDQAKRIQLRESEEKRPPRKVSKGLQPYHVFLGGSCNPTTWRKDDVIPILEREEISFYNPQVSHWKPEMIEEEHFAKQNSAVLFFVIDNITRNTASTVEVSYYSGLKRNLVLVLLPSQSSELSIGGEKVGDEEMADLEEGKLVMQELAGLQGIPIFNDVSKAVNSLAMIWGKTARDSPSNLNLQSMKKGSKNLTSIFRKLRGAFDSKNEANTGEISLQDVLKIGNLPVADLRTAGVLEKETKENNPSENFRGSFNHLCSTVAELKSSQEREHLIYNCGWVSSGGGLGLSSKPLMEPTASSSSGSTSVVAPDASSVSAAVSTGIVAGSELPSCSAYKFSKDSDHCGFFSGSMSEPEAGSSWGSSVLSFLTPLRKALEWVSPVQLSTTLSQKHNLTYDVFLGGSSIGTSWREDAMRLLKKHGLKFTRSASNHWTKLLVRPTVAEAERSRMKLFVITDTSRSLAEMCLAAHFIGRGSNVVLCVQLFTEDSLINGEKLTELAVKEYNRGRKYLKDLALREGIHVFDEISTALEFVVCAASGNIN